MSSISRLLDKTADVYRRVATGNNLAYSATAAAEEVPVRVEPVNAEDVLLSDGGLMRTVKIYAEIDADIQESDKLTIGGIDYFVNGVQRFDYGQEHLEIMANNDKGE